ncbi:MAG: helix-turn-helix transcriptional regulator [Thiobacillus sp.]
MTSPLKQARLSRGLTLEQVASAVDIDTGNLSRIERGAQVPSVARTARLAKFFAGAVTETQIVCPCKPA